MYPGTVLVICLYQCCSVPVSIAAVGFLKYSFVPKESGRRGVQGSEVFISVVRSGYETAEVWVQDCWKQVKLLPGCSVKCTSFKLYSSVCDSRLG